MKYRIVSPRLGTPGEIYNPPVWVNIGAPIDPARYRDRESDRLALRQMIDEVMFEIRNLSGQEYVDQYATKTDETLPARTAGVITSEGLSPNGSATNGAGGAACVNHARARAEMAAAMLGRAMGC